MEESEQAEAASVESKLKEAFTDGAFVAYAKAVGLKWSGESVDVYANEIRRLAGLAGFKGDGLDCFLKLAFVTGFPDSISAELQQCSPSVGMSALISKARVLSSNRGALTSVGAVANTPQGSGSGRDFRQRSGGEKHVFKGKCFRCEGPHMARDCPDRKSVKCYICSEEGHLSYSCPSSKSKMSGNC